MNSDKKYYFLLSIYLLLSSLLFSGTKTNYNVTEYGAKADGKTLDTKAIQKAIDECADNGGGTVNFPAGNYLTGTIIMKDNVVLHLLAGSKILGSKNIEDYPMYFQPVANNMDKDVYRALIRGENLKNIGITGLGIIDGQGKYLQGIPISDENIKEIEKVYTDKSRYVPGKKNDQRPFLLRFVSSNNIIVEGITLQHPAKWTQHYLACDGVTVRDVKVYAHGGENNDLIDIDGSQNVVITGMIGDSDDDGITLKSTGKEIVENVIISDCILRSRTNPIKAGTDSYGGFRNITITNCYIGPSLADGGYSGRDEGLAGIALELVDGGVLENVTISNIVMEEMAAPIFIRLGNRARTYKPNMDVRPIGSLNNIKISNIVSKNAGKTGCSIIGEIDHPIKNVSISNVNINFDGGGTVAESLVEKPELVNEYPESTMLGDLPAYGFFVRHVDGITFRDVELSYNEEEHRPAMLFNDVKNLKLLNFDAEISDDALGQIVLQNSENVFVNGCSPKMSKIFLRLERESKDINIVGNNLSDVEIPIFIDNTIKVDDLRISPNLTGASTVFEFLQPNIERDSLGMVSIYYPNNPEIYYTTDGSQPTISSNKYLQAFEQISPTVIKATAFENNEVSSTATLKLERAQVIAPHISPANQYFYKSINVKLVTNTAGADIYYTLDGSEPTKSSQKYERNLEINKSATLRTKAFKNDYAPSNETVTNYLSIEKEKGVQYKYYENMSNTKWEKLPNFLLLEPLTEGTINKFGYDGIQHSETYFGLVLHGFIKIKQDGEYTFYVGSNDGSKLFIDNKELINNDGNHGYIEKSGKVYLEKGEHLIEVRYYQAGGVKHLKVFWEGPGIKKQEIIPN